MIAAAFAAGLGVGLLVRDAPRDRAEPTRPTAFEIPGGTVSLRRAIEELPADAPTRGSGVVTGQVRRPDGTPIRGVLIVASPRPDRSVRTKRARDARPEVPDIMDIVARERRLRAGRREARTLADGSYRVEGLGAGSYSVWPYADDTTFSTVQKSRVRAGESVDFAGEWFARVETAIEVAGSGPPAHAFVRVVRRQGATTSIRKQLWNPAQPWIELGAGMIELTAVLDDDSGARSDVQTIVIRDGVPPRPLRFVVTPRPALRLRVHAALRGAPLLAWAQRMPQKFGDDPMQFGWSGRPRMSDKNRPVFLFHDLEPGRYRVGVGYGEIAYQPQVAAFVQVEGGITDYLIDLPEPPAGSVLRVRLLDPAGEPVSLVTWNVAQEKNGNESSSSGVESLRGADGVHFVPIMGGGEYAGGRSTIEAVSPKWGSIGTEFDPGSEEVIELRFRRAAEVTGVLRGYAGSGYEGRIRFQWEAPEARPSAMEFGGVGSGTIAADGTMRMKPQQAGKRVLAIYVSTGSHWWARVAEKTFTLEAGRQSVVAELPRLHQLRVAWQGKGRPELMMIPGQVEDIEGLGVWEATVDESNVATFSGLPAGRYKLSGTDTETDIEIPAQTEVRLP